jgi:hypothetical protein
MLGPFPLRPRDAAAPVPHISHARGDAGLSFGTAAFSGGESVMGGQVSGNGMFHWLSMAESKRTPPLLPSAPAPAPVLACSVYGTSDHTSVGRETSSFGPRMCGLVERAGAPRGGGRVSAEGRGRGA